MGRFLFFEKQIKGAITNQPEVGCEWGQASQGTRLRHPATAGRTPNRKIAFFSTIANVKISLEYRFV